MITRTWRSPTGHLLLDGKDMTHQQAVHLCLTHTRNEIDQDRTTPTRITYEATQPAPSFTSQPPAPTAETE